MFIGHFAIGLGAKKAVPGMSLGTLFLAVQFLDLLWPSLLLLNLEHAVISPGITQVTPIDFTDYPISHSLAMVMLWAMLGGALYYLVQKNSIYALVFGACIASHWFLDLMVHRPDLPLYPGHSPKWGLGLWDHPFLTVMVEGLMFVVGTFLYVQKTRANNGAGKYGLWALVALFLLVYVANLMGPPPPSMLAIAWAGQLQWLFVLMAFWVDRNRTSLP